MRTALAATAFTALALFTAAPTALATNDGGGGSPGGDHAKQAERLMQAADKFDKKAGSMRTRAGRLRATALELRLEAEELAGNEAADPATDTGKSGRQGSSMTTTTTTTTTTITTGDSGGDAGPAPAPDGGGSKGDDSGDESFADPDACAWDGEDDLGFSREHDAEPPKEDDDASDNGAEICHLLRLADRLEQRAGALDAAAARMQSHACKLREKAAKLLAEGGETTAQRMLKKAAALRQAATKLRAQADAARDAAFEGTDVDDEAVASIRRMELKAAAFDKRADRLEARAATMVS